MRYIFSILQYSLGSLVWGVLLTVAGVALMFAIIKSWRRNCTFTPVSFMVGALLFCFLSFQSVLLCGAITIKSMAGEIRSYINLMVENLPGDTVFSTVDSQQILDNINETYPLVGRYLDWADFEGHTPTDIAGAMADKMVSYMNWYMLRRVAWSVLFVVIGAAAILKTMEKTDGGGKRIPSTSRYVYDD